MNPSHPLASETGEAGAAKARNEDKIIVDAPGAAKRRGFDAAILLALCGVVFVYGLGRIALLGPDEPRYAEVAREMFVSGDYISTRLCGCLWFEKPALLYWMAAGAYRLFGVGEMAARLPSAVAATAAALFLYSAVAKTASRRLGLTAGAVLATSGLVIAYARIAAPDMALTAAMSAALLSSHLAAQPETRNRLGLWALCGAAMGLAVLAKGLVAIVLGGPIIVLYLAAIGRLRSLELRHALTVLAVFLATAATWYAPATARYGRTFIDEFFVQHHYKRFVTNQFHHPQPPYFYLVVAVAGLLPWSGFLIPALARLRNLKPRTNKIDGLLLLAWIWAAVPLLFFSLSKSKLPGYILPIFPALAIIVAVEIERAWAGNTAALLRAAVWGSAAALVAVEAGLFFYLRRESIVVASAHWILIFLPAALAAAVVLAAVLRRNRIVIAGTVVTAAAMVAVSALVLLPPLSDMLTLRPLSLEAAAALQPGEKIAFFLKKEFAPVFYAQGRVVCGVGDSDIFNALREDFLAEALQTESSLVVITTENWRRGLEEDPRFDTELIARQGEALAYRVRLRPSNLAGAQ